jgi:integrase
MDSKKYIGMDVHKESISIAVMNGAGKIVMECVIETKASMILQFFDGLRGDLHVTHWTACTRNHYHNLVSLAFRLGIENEIVETNPARAVRREKQDNNRVRFLTPEEEKKLRTAVRGNPTWAPHEPELDLGIATGLRRSSMYLNLVWENVDSAGRTLTIPRTKNGEQITLPLNQDAMRALSIFRSRGDGNGRVVRNSSGKTLSYNADWFVPAVRAAGIKNFRWHDLRHTFASRLRQAGVPLDKIAELLGHKGLAMTKRYAHLLISNLHEAVSRISNHPTEAISTTVAPALIVETAQVARIQ